MKQVFCFTGPPGSGKGTHSIRFFNKYCSTFSLSRFSVGDALRAMNKSSVDGNLSSTEDVESIISSFLDEDYRYHIIDGYPRSMEQMNNTFFRLEDSQITDLTIVNLSVNDENVLIQRLSERYSCGNCGYSINNAQKTCDNCLTELSRREDDLSIESIKNRLDVYYRSNEQIKDFCSARGIKFVEFDATLPLEVIYNAIDDYLSERLRKNSLTH